MIRVLVDHNIEGHAALLWSVLPDEEWNAYEVEAFLTLEAARLPPAISDRELWRIVQKEGMLLLTGNRNMEDPNSLEATIREECRPDTLPVLTIADLDRLLADAQYRFRVALCVAEVALTLDARRGTGRIWVPF
jgi:hypothetical protein